MQICGITQIRRRRMSGSVNKVILLGRLGRDPESRTMNSGDKVVSFSLATSETWRDKASGERKEKTEWHNVVIWNENIGKVAEQYLKKGSEVYLEGQLQTREFTDKDGNQRKSTEIVLQRFRGELTMIGNRNDGDGERGGGSRGGGGSRSSGSRQSTRDADLDDDIPF